MIKSFLRIGCGLIDYLLLLLPVQLLMLGIMDRDLGATDFLFRLLLAVYGTLMTEYNHGATLGKYLGKLMVVDRSGAKASILYVGLRELVKSMYLIPIYGWIAGGISVVTMLLFDRTLHDMAGGTAVIFRWDYEPPEESE